MGASGATGPRAVAGEFNDGGTLTRHRGRRHQSAVMNLLDRLGLRETA